MALEEWDKPVAATVDQHLDAERVLASLDDRDRRLYLLHVVAGLTSSEIASQSDLSPIAIRVRLHRAKAESTYAPPPPWEDWVAWRVLGACRRTHRYGWGPRDVTATGAASTEKANPASSSSAALI